MKRGIVAIIFTACVAAFSSSWTTVIAQVSFDRLLRAAALRGHQHEDENQPGQRRGFHDATIQSHP